MSAPTMNAQPCLIASKPAMVWKPELSEFVLNRLVQLVRSGVCFNMGFKEHQMKKVAADVLAFAVIHVTTLQLYNHIRNWRTNWSVTMMMKSDPFWTGAKMVAASTTAMKGRRTSTSRHKASLSSCNRSESIYMSMSSALTGVPCGLQRYPKHRQYVGTPITNYAQMKTIFTPRFVCKAQLF
ncbi:hypothetical protein QYE76_024401 [Lolium multiflorum]|uniref:Uncharacterized protein n=1 Tax=Lolium multiflorum TaxID=4521 RepID=A0AAD8RG51_LOLMU|nr:hypothetical protein QYE76_024401 [Lolium multiflorum]